MNERVAFLMKDLVLLAASFYLLRQDVLRSVSSPEPSPMYNTKEREKSIGCCERCQPTAGRAPKT
jgi:hypothetical protein